MKLALIQLKGRDIAQYEAIAAHILSLLEDACKTDADLILLPECAYPSYGIGIAEDEGWRGLLPSFLEKIGAMAGAYRKYIALGAAFSENGTLRNSLLIYDRKGAMVGRADKSNLWHFDGKWFTAGKSFFTFETEFGTIGAMVCADGRIPEIARALRLQGARLILDTVNLVANAPTPRELSNQQYAFMLRVRARENGAYIAVCNKCGVEDHAITMLGRSFVVDPEGRIVAEASPDREEIVSCDIDLTKETSFPPLPRRKPALYAALASPTEHLPAHGGDARALPLKDLAFYTAMARFPSASPDEYIERAAQCVRTCRIMDARLIVLPPAPHADRRSVVQALSPLMDGTCAGIFSCAEGGAERAVVFSRGGELASFAPTHLEGADPGAEIGVAELWPGLRIAVVFREEMEIPEIARVAALRGADLLVWYDARETGGAPRFMSAMQTRAAENRVFVARTTPCDGDDFSRIVNPDGQMICTTFSAADHIACGMVYTALSRLKTVVPGTDILASRIPEAYRSLTL